MDLCAAAAPATYVLSSYFDRALWLGSGIRECADRTIGRTHTRLPYASHHRRAVESQHLFSTDAAHDRCRRRADRRSWLVYGRQTLWQNRDVHALPHLAIAGFM